MAKVINKTTTDTFDKFETLTVGECSNCGHLVQKHAKGYDEYCPECGSSLDWSYEQKQKGSEGVK